MANSYFSSQWQRKKLNDDAVRDRGSCLIEVVTQGLTRRVHVVCPYNATFNIHARDLGGRYRRKSQRWTFSAAQLAIVTRICREVYGSESVTVTE